MMNCTIILRKFWSLNKLSAMEIKKKVVQGVGNILLIVFLLAGLNLMGCASLVDEQAAGTDTSHDKYSYLEEQWGIRPESLRLSAAGHILDFRYKVTNPEKAVKILANPEKTYLVDQASGMKLAVPSSPKVGSLRQTTTEPEAGRIYFSLFSNRGKIVKPGGKVTIVMGEFRAEDLTVE